MPNTDLLRRTLHQCQTDRATWTQEAFVTYCGTGHCFGGWAITLSGIHIDPGTGTIADDDLPAAVRDRLPPRRVTMDGREHRLAQVAAILLDVPRWVIGEPHLFDAYNTLDDLSRMVDELCAAEPGGTPEPGRLEAPAPHDPFHDAAVRFCHCSSCFPGDGA